MATYSSSSASLPPLLNAQSKNANASFDFAASLGCLYIRMNVAVVIGQLFAPGWLFNDKAMPGALAQFAPAAAAAKVSASGATYWPSWFFNSTTGNLLALA